MRRTTSFPPVSLFLLLTSILLLISAFSSGIRSEEVTGAAEVVTGSNILDEQRCRCICPELKFNLFDNKEFNGTEKEKNRRIYTNRTNPKDCNPKHVISLYSVIHENIEVNSSKLETFYQTCQCSFETRNVTMLKVVVSIVIVAISILVLYMTFLLCLDPMLRRSGASGRNYQQQIDEDENIFATRDANSADSGGGNSAGAGTVGNGRNFGGELDEFGSPTHSISSASGGPSTSSGAGTGAGVGENAVRPRGVLNKVEAEQNKWMQKVEKQRKAIFTDHSMLN